MSSPCQPAGVAEAVDPLVVREDDLADRLVAVDLGDDPRPLVGVLLDLLPVGLGQLDVALQDPVGEHELADVVEQAGRVHELLVGLRKPGRGGDLARVAGHGGAVAGGHPVAQVERPEQGAQQGDLEAGELLGLQLELVGALLRQKQGADQVLEDDQDDREQGHGRQADLDVQVGDPDRRAAPRRARRGGPGRATRRTLLDSRVPST